MLSFNKEAHIICSYTLYISLICPLFCNHTYPFFLKKNQLSLLHTVPSLSRTPPRSPSPSLLSLLHHVRFALPLLLTASFSLSISRLSLCVVPSPSHLLQSQFLCSRKLPPRHISLRRAPLPCGWGAIFLFPQPTHNLW